LHADLLRGCYLLDAHTGRPAADAPAVTLLGSGAILREVLQAAATLRAQGVRADVFSVTSWSELARDGIACETRELHGEGGSLPFITRQLARSAGPIIAATDYVRAVPDSVRAFVPAGRRYVTLGTDGFGRSDTRAALRSYFEVDAASIVRTAQALIRPE